MLFRLTTQQAPSSQPAGWQRVSYVSAGTELAGGLLPSPGPLFTALRGEREGGRETELPTAAAGAHHPSRGVTPRLAAGDRLTRAAAGDRRRRRRRRPSGCCRRGPRLRWRRLPPCPPARCCHREGARTLRRETVPTSFHGVGHGDPGRGGRGCPTAPGCASAITEGH